MQLGQAPRPFASASRPASNARRTASVIDGFVGVGESFLNWGISMGSDPLGVAASDQPRADVAREAPCNRADTDDREKLRVAHNDIDRQRDEDEEDGPSEERADEIIHDLGPQVDAHKR